MVLNICFDGMNPLSNRFVIKRQEDDSTDQFYRSSRIVAMDIFSIADDIFQRDEVVKSDESEGEGENEGATPAMTDPSSSTGAYKMMDNDEIDIDDLELYGDEAFGKIRSLGSVDIDTTTAETTADTMTSTSTSTQKQWTGSSMPPSRYNTLAGYISGAGLSDNAKEIVVVCRQSGQLQMF